MKLIFAQGNPGLQYQSTRHNAGYRLIDTLAQKQGLTFQEKAKFQALIADYTARNGEKILLAKTTTFYNDSGVAARALVDFYKLDTNDILVLHDELALPFGTLRSREKGRDAGNNGIKSLNSHLGENYARLRIGIWNDHADRAGALNFVLEKFSKAEDDLLETTIMPKGIEMIESFIDGPFLGTSLNLLPLDAE